MPRTRRAIELGIFLSVLSSSALLGTTWTVQVGPSGQFAFSPESLTITAGDTVHWVWNGLISHSTTSGSCPGGICTGDGHWDSGVHSSPFTFDQTFPTAGTFPYFCSVHLSAMQGTITVATPAQYQTVAPCRIADTRNPAGPYGGPALAANADRTFVIGGQCAIPLTATAVAFNFTITQPTGQGDLRIFPAGGNLPLVSTLNWSPGQTRANNAVVALGPSSDITVHVDQASGTVQFLIDVNGYFQ